ncbi:ectopic p granules protein [Anaeramoeba flamelloides]|uniref:Ectopic p granules protein n=1 Tax=Anaeramoeba flamelloides TaxID=1746091 RepID=A0ABQ8YHW5_9EUKA|nr:ectopic p granules protein [Anaeramoeba flamelloides]
MNLIPPENFLLQRYPIFLNRLVSQPTNSHKLLSQYSLYTEKKRILDSNIEQKKKYVEGISFDLYRKETKTQHQTKSCPKGGSVSASVSYEVIYFDQGKANRLREQFDELQKLVHEDLSSGSSQLLLAQSRLNVFFDKYTKITLKKEQNLDNLYLILDSCFNCYRLVYGKYSGDYTIMADLQKWISTLLVYLLQMGTAVERHYAVFQLYHLPGSGKWGHPLISVPEVFNEDVITDCFLRASMLLHPVVMNDKKVGLLQLNESDMIYYYKTLHINEVLKFALNTEGGLDPIKAAEFVANWLFLMEKAILKFSHFKEFRKFLGQDINSILILYLQYLTAIGAYNTETKQSNQKFEQQLQTISDQQQKEKENKNENENEKEKSESVNTQWTQTEFTDYPFWDRLVIDLFKHFSMVNDRSVFELVNNLPFNALRIESAFKLFQIVIAPMDSLNQIKSFDDWQIISNEIVNVKKDFQERNIKSNSCFYLFDMLTNLATYQNDFQLANCVCYELFNTIKLCCTKKRLEIRPLLIALKRLCLHFPDLISYLLGRMPVAIQIMKEDIFLVFNSLSFQTWKPCLEDLKIFLMLLDCNDPDSIQFRFIMFLLENIRYELNRIPIERLLNQNQNEIEKENETDENSKVVSSKDSSPKNLSKKEIKSLKKMEKKKLKQLKKIQKKKKFIEDLSWLEITPGIGPDPRIFRMYNAGSYEENWILEEIQMKLVIQILEISQKFKKNKECCEWCWRVLYKFTTYNNFGNPTGKLFDYPVDSKYKSIGHHFKDISKIKDPIFAYFLLKFCKIDELNIKKQLFEILFKNKEYYSAAHVLYILLPGLITEQLGSSEGTNKFEAPCSELFLLLNMVLKNTNTINTHPPFESVPNKKKKKQVKPDWKFSNLFESLASSTIILRRINEMGLKNKNVPSETEQSAINSRLKSIDFLQFWLTYITFKPGWNSNNENLHILNSLFKISYLCGYREIIVAFVKSKFKEVLTKGKNKKKKFQELKQKNESLIQTGKSFAGKTRKRLMNSYPWYYFEILLCELLWKVPEFEKITNLWNSLGKNDKSTKKFLKNNKIKENFNIIDMWLEFALELVHKTVLLPLVLQVILSLYFFTNLDNVTIPINQKNNNNNNEMPKFENPTNKNWNGGDLITLNGKKKEKFLEEIKKKINNEKQNNFKLKEKKKKIIRPNNQVMKDVLEFAQDLFNINDLNKIFSKYQNTPKRIFLLKIIIDSIVKQSNMLEKPVNETTGEDYLKKNHNILWWGLTTLEPVLQEAVLSYTMFNNVKNYLSYLSTGKFVQIPRYIPNKPNNILITHLPQRDIEKEMEAVNMKEQLVNSTFYDRFKEIPEDTGYGNLELIQKKIEGKLNSFSSEVNKFEHHKSKHQNMDNQFLAMARNLWENQPTTHHATRTCHWTTRDSEGNTHHHSQTIHFTFHITQIVMNTSVNQQMLANRSKVLQYTDYRQNPNNTFDEDLKLGIMIFEFFVSFLLENYPLEMQTGENLCVTLGGNWFFTILNYELNNAKLTAYPPFENFSKQSIFTLGENFIKTNSDFIPKMIDLMEKNTRAIVKAYPYFNPNLNPLTFTQNFNYLINIFLKTKNPAYEHPLSRFLLSNWFQTMKGLVNSQKLELTQWDIFNQELLVALLSSSVETIFKISKRFFHFCVNSLNFYLKFEFPSYLDQITKGIFSLVLEQKTNSKIWKVFKDSSMLFATSNLEVVQDLAQFSYNTFIATLSQQLLPRKKNLYWIMDDKMVKNICKYFFQNVAYSLLNINQNLLTENNILITSDLVFSLYSPFVITRFDYNGQGISLFDKADDSKITKVVSFMCNHLNNLHQKFPSTLNDLLQFLVSKICGNYNNPYIVSKVTQLFATIPNWNLTFPSLVNLHSVTELISSPYHLLVRNIYSRINWTQTENLILNLPNGNVQQTEQTQNNTNSINEEQKNIFYSLLFQSFVKLTDKYTDFQNNQLSSDWLGCLQKIAPCFINSQYPDTGMHWQNLKFDAMFKILDEMYIDPKIVKFDLNVYNNKKYLLSIYQYPQSIDSPETRFFAKYQLLKNIFQIENPNNTQKFSSFLMCVVHLLNKSSHLIRIKEKILTKRKWYGAKKKIIENVNIDRFSNISQIQESSFSLVLNNVKILYSELWRVTLIHPNSFVETSKLLLNFLSTIEETSILDVLVENILQFEKSNPLTSLPIINNICQLQSNNLLLKIMFIESSLYNYFNANGTLGQLLQVYNLIDISDSTFFDLCSSNYAVFTMYYYVLVKIFENQGNLDISMAKSYFQKLSEAIVAMPLELGSESKWFILFQIWFNLILYMLKFNEKSLAGYISAKLEQILSKLEDLTKKKPKPTSLNYTKEDNFKGFTNQIKLSIQAMITFFYVIMGYSKNDILSKEKHTKKDVKQAENKIKSFNKLNSNKDFPTYEKKISTLSIKLTKIKNNLTPRDCSETMSIILKQFISVKDYKFLSALLDTEFETFAWINN